MPYATQMDLEHQLSPSTVRQLYDDQNDGQVYVEAIQAVLERASVMVDSYLARVYKGPFPVAGTPQKMIRMATIEFAIAYSFERHPEYVHTYGEEYRASTREKRAHAMMERIANATQEIADWLEQPKQLNIGGIITTSGPRTILDNPDGTPNGGDF